jgi:N-carbamoylputrescine amidase
MTTVRFAAVQTGPASEDRAANLDRAVALLREIPPGPGAVVLPELFALPFWCVGLHDPAWFELAEGLEGPTVSAMAAEAHRLGSYMVVPFFERGAREGEYFNSAALLDPRGEVVPGRLPDGQAVTTYRKNAISMYSWDGHDNDEKWYFRAGDGYPIFETDFGPVGILICYDRWYPEAWRVLALQGAQAVFVANASEVYVSDMVVPSMRTCAAQNVLFAVSVNRAGVERLRGVETRYYGRSCILGPRGEVLAEAGDGVPDVVVSADVDLDRVTADRRRLWVYRDRRPELYGLVADTGRSLDVGREG